MSNTDEIAQVGRKVKMVAEDNMLVPAEMVGEITDVDRNDPEQSYRVRWDSGEMFWAFNCDIEMLPQ